MVDVLYLNLVIDLILLQLACDKSKSTSVRRVDELSVIGAIRATKIGVVSTAAGSH